MGKAYSFLWLGQLFGIDFLKVLSCMSAFCWQTLQKSLIKSVKMWEYGWDQHLAHAFLLQDRNIKNRVFNPPLQTHTHRWRDGLVFDLFDMICLIWFCSLINLTLLSISIYSAYNNQNNLNWLYMVGLLFHLHFLSSDFALIQNQLTSYVEVLQQHLLCWIKTTEPNYPLFNWVFMRHFWLCKNRVNYHFSDLVAVSIFFVQVRVNTKHAKLWWILNYCLQTVYFLMTVIEAICWLSCSLTWTAQEALFVILCKSRSYFC